MFKMRWDDDKLEKLVNNEVVKRLTASALIVEGEIKLDITNKGLVDTNLYRGGITHEIYLAKLTAKIGSPIKGKPPYLPYPFYLEVGTRYIQAYAPMRTGLANAKSRVQAVWR